VRWFKPVTILILLPLLVGARSGTKVGATAQAPSSGLTTASVDRQVWTDLAAAPNRRATFVVVMREPAEGDPASAIPAQMGLALTLEVLQRVGSIDLWTIHYGANRVVVNGSRSVVVFLAARPDVAAIRSHQLADGQEAAFRIDAVAGTGQITGQVTGPDGTTPLPGITVTAYQQTGPFSWVVAGSATSSATGTYAIGSLSTGIYRARFRDTSGDHVEEFYDDKPSFTLATNFDVTDGQTTSGISASLDQAGKIAGSVTDLSDGSSVADIAVGAWYHDGLAWVNAGGGVTNSSGQYVVGGLAPGLYRLMFEDVYSPPRYLTEFYDNKASIEAANDVGVTAGATTANIDAALGGYGKIAGAATGPDGTTAITGIDIDVWRYNPDWMDWEWVSFATTEVSGDYEVNGLITEDYRVEFSDSLGQFASEFYDDQPDIQSATDVHVELGATTPDIDASLNLAPMSVDLPLVADWNLVSLSISPEDPDPSVVLSPINGNYERAWAYDGCDSADPWKVYDPDVPASDLDALDETQGYWLLVTSPVTLTVDGVRPLETAISLCAGWNLIGYPSGTSREVTEVLADIEGKYDLVYGYDAADLLDPWKKYDPDAPFGNDLEEMQPGFGYWVRLTQPSTFVIQSR
jgi:hypothetical protein